MNMFYEKIAERGLPGRFDYLDHMTDVFVVSYGNNVLELFENAGLALFHTMTDTSSVEAVFEKSVEAEGFDLENTLYRWLEELLTLYYTERVVCREIIIDEFIVRRAGEELRYLVRGRCCGEVFNRDKHVGKLEVKAPTYSLMKILKDEQGWRAYFVLDI